MLKRPIELGYFVVSSVIASSDCAGNSAISSGVNSRTIVSPVVASWNVPIGFVMFYAFRYP